MNWGLTWEMDGLQWFVLKIDLFEPSMCGDSLQKAQYKECIKFIYDKLLPYCKQFYHYDEVHVSMYCPECTHILHKHDIKFIMNYHFPEEMI